MNEPASTPTSNKGPRPQDLDAAAVRHQARRLARAAEPPWLHPEVAGRMAERLPFIKLQPRRVLDATPALGASDELLRQAYPVLKQWQQVGLNSGYDDMFVNLVHTGGWQAAQSVAENVGPFLNAGNVGRFEQVARQLQPGARQQALLKSLRDYQLQLQGG